MIGADALVPPTVIHMPANRTLTPVLGSATADTSATVRLAQPGSVCQDGLASNALQPLPAPSQTVSLQPRAAAALRFRDVPPTAVRNGDAAGYETPNPLSPE